MLKWAASCCTLLKLPRDESVGVQRVYDFDDVRDSYWIAVRLCWRGVGSERTPWRTLDMPEYPRGLLELGCVSLL